MPAGFLPGRSSNDRPAKSNHSIALPAEHPPGSRWQHLPDERIGIVAEIFAAERPPAHEQPVVAVARRARRIDAMLARLAMRLAAPRRPPGRTSGSAPGSGPAPHTRPKPHGRHRRLLHCRLFGSRFPSPAGRTTEADPFLPKFYVRAKPHAAAQWTRGTVARNRRVPAIIGIRHDDTEPRRQTQNLPVLHERGCFVIQSWDVGSARYLQGLGFRRWPPVPASLAGPARWRRAARARAGAFS